LTKPSFDIYNSDGLSLKASGNIKFPQSGETPNVSEIQPQLEQLKDYLAKNPSLQMLLIGNMLPMKRIIHLLLIWVSLERRH
jgi:hypothetical protein